MPVFFGMETLVVCGFEDRWFFGRYLTREECRDFVLGFALISSVCGFCILWGVSEVRVCRCSSERGARECEEARNMVLTSQRHLFYSAGHRIPKLKAKLKHDGILNTFLYRV